MIGFSFRETMRGTFYLLDAPVDDRAIDFTIRVSGRGLRFLETRTATIEGEVTIEGFAERAALTGTIAFRLDEKRLPYEFTFVAADGKPYRFRGQKDFNALKPADSVSTLPASVYDESGKEVGRAVVRFDLRADTRKLLRSFRVSLARSA